MHFDGPIRTNMAAQYLLSSVSRPLALSHLELKGEGKEFFERGWGIQQHGMAAFRHLS